MTEEKKYSEVWVSDDKYILLFSEEEVRAYIKSLIKAGCKFQIGFKKIQLDKPYTSNEIVGSLIK